MPDPACLYHAAPLHYLLRIGQDGALYPKSVLAGRGIRPRATAARRDRMLGLADYLHLSLHSQTPLLADKLRRGYPHALLVFDRARVLALPGAALLPYNTKAWFDKAAYAPVTDAASRQSLLDAHARHGRYPSLEVLVKYGLGLDALKTIAFCAEEECVQTRLTLDALSVPAPAALCVCPALFPLKGEYQPTTQALVFDYFAACRDAGDVLPPPEIAFD